jgi:hypothetical protein
METLLKTVDAKRALWSKDMDKGTFVAPMNAIMEVFWDFTNEEKKILVKKMFVLLSEQHNSPYMSNRFLETIKHKAQEFIKDVNILPEFQIIFNKLMCLAITKNGYCCEVISNEAFCCPKHPLLKPQKQDIGFPQIEPFDVDFSHFNLRNLHVPIFSSCIDIVKKGKSHHIALLAAAIQCKRWKDPDEEIRYYDGMIATALHFGNLQALEIFWQSIYYYDRNSPYYSSDLITAVQVGGLREFKHVLSAFIHSSSVCPEEVSLEELEEYCEYPKIMEYITTITPFTTQEIVTPEDLQDWCECKLCKNTLNLEKFMAEYIYSANFGIK